MKIAFAGCCPVEQYCARVTASGEGTEKKKNKQVGVSKRDIWSQRQLATVEEAEALVQQMMVGIAGYKSVEMIDGESPLGLATFDSPIQAMKFIKSQKKMVRSTRTSYGLLKIDHGQNVLDARL